MPTALLTLKGQLFSPHESLLSPLGTPLIFRAVSVPHGAENVEGMGIFLALAFALTLASWSAA